MAKTFEQGQKDFQKIYKQYRSFHNNQKISDNEIETVKKVRDKFTQARRARQNNCYWGDQSSENAGAGNWENHWSKAEKAKLMWAKRPDADDFRSNIKSPMIAGRINSFVNMFKKLNLGWDARPNTDEDRNSAKIAAKALDYWYNNEDVKLELTKAADGAATYGSAIFRITYLEEKRKYRFPKLKAEEMTEEDKKKIEERKTVYKEAEEVTVKDEIVVEYVPIRESYPDPQALCLHGVNREATYHIRRKFMNIEDFKSQYKSNPSAQNISRVKPVSQYRADTSYEFFRPPEDIIGTDSVEVIEYENVLDDEFIVLANDVLVIDTPLPFNHKEITYHKIDFIKNPDQYYGIGLSDLLMKTQGSQEIMLNMILDKEYRSLEPRFFVDANNYGELTEDMLRTDTQMIPIDLSDNKPITSKIQQLRIDPISFDAFQTNDLLERMATIASQIDPSQLSVQQSGKTATATLQNREQLQSMINGVIDNFAMEGFTSAGRQVWALMKQFWSIPKVRKVTGNEKKMEKKFKTIRLEGVKLNLNTKTKELESKNIDKAFSFFELKDEYLNTKENLDIHIKPDSMEIVSKGVEMQKAQELFAQLMPFAVDPNNPQTMQMNPNGYINAPKLFQFLIDRQSAPEELLITPEENEEKAKEEAMDHATTILIKGEFIKGEPGQPISHVKAQSQIILALTAQRDNLQKKVDDDMVKQQQAIDENLSQILPSIPPQFDPNTGQPIDPMTLIEQMGLPTIPEPDETLEAQIEELNTKIMMLDKHNAMDAMPVGVLPSMASQEAQAGLQQPQPEAPIPPGMDASVPMPNMDAGTGMSGEGVNMPQPMQDPNMMV